MGKLELFKDRHCVDDGTAVQAAKVGLFGGCVRFPSYCNFDHQIRPSGFEIHCYDTCQLCDPVNSCDWTACYDDEAFLRAVVEHVRASVVQKKLEEKSLVQSRL